MLHAAPAIAGMTAASLFAVFLLAKYRHMLYSVLLGLVLLACAALEMFDLLALSHPADLLVWKRAALVSEAALVPLLLLLVLSLRGPLRFSRLSRVSLVFLLLSPVFLSASLLSPFESLYFSPDFGEETILFLKNPGYAFYLGLMLFLIYVLVELELALRGLERADLWCTKFELIGIGMIVAMHLFYYSQGLLYRSLDMTLLPARSTALTLGVALMVYSRLRRGFPKGLSVSRQTAYRSVVILVVGVYLLALGLAGEGMLYLGFDSRRVLLLLMGVLGGCGLLAVVLSDTLRRKTRVFIHKNFFKAKYDYRPIWLEFTRRLAGAHHAATLYQAILSFFCETFSVRGAALYLRRSGGEDFDPFGHYDMVAPFSVIPAGNPLITFVGERGWVFWRDGSYPDVEQALDALFPHQDIHFVVPLFFEDTLEALVILGSPIDEQEIFFYEDFDLMKALAAQAAAVLHNQRLVEELARAGEMAAIGKVSTFVMHDLKNLVSNLALATENARDYLDDLDFQQDLLETLHNSVARMRTLIDRLRDVGSDVSLRLAEHDLVYLVAEAVQDLPGHAVQIAGESLPWRVDAAELEKVVTNLAMNALEATGGQGPVVLSVGREHGQAFIRCRDEGCGMSDDFVRERLFKPFETTKSKGFGIGLYQCRQIVGAHGGRIEVHSVEGQGTEFTVWLGDG